MHVDLLLTDVVMPQIGGVELSRQLQNTMFGLYDMFTGGQLSQITIFALCLLCLIMDGFDVQMMGYVGPALIRDWKIAGSQLGPVFAAANFGVLIGALTLSMLADKIGRRPVLVGATLAFSAMTLLTGYAQSMEQLLWLRFLGGIPMGCIIPNATALVGEAGFGRFDFNGRFTNDNPSAAAQPPQQASG